MKKIIIEGFRLGQEVLITGFTPPVKGKVVDMYEIASTMVDDVELKRKYPKGVPIFEVVLEDGKLRSFVKDVVRRV